MNGTQIGQLVIYSFIKAIPQVLSNLLGIFWPFFVPLILILVVRVGFFYYRRYQLAKSGMFEIDKMNGTEFEQFLAGLFERMGYKVQMVGSLAGDYGADLIVEKNGERTAVQAKCWHNFVGEKAVQEVFTSMNMYHCTRALVVTNWYFTHQARKLAQSNNVQLWNRSYLMKVILSHQK